MALPKAVPFSGNICGGTWLWVDPKVGLDVDRRPRKVLEPERQAGLGEYVKNQLVVLRIRVA